MRNGLYKVAFRTPRGEGSGVVHLQDGKLHGGDSMQYYVGEYHAEGDHFRADVASKEHSRYPGMQSVFGVPTAHISLTGKFQGDTGTFDGTAREAPGVKFTATLTRICD